MPRETTCFVMMPFGKKPGANGDLIDFDDVYQTVIAPVVTSLGLQSTRADEVPRAGSVHKDMLERIAGSDVVIVDITTGNPNVFYELGVRHALRPRVTVLLKQRATAIPFDIAGLRLIDSERSYKGVVAAQQRLRQFIRNGLASESPDSLVYELLPALQVILPPQP